MRRGENVRLPKLAPLNPRTTLDKFKEQLSLIYPQIVGDWGIDKRDLTRSLRVWLLTNEMSPEEFAESFNSGIASSKDD